MIYRRKRNYENAQKRVFKGAGRLEIPQLKATHLRGGCKFTPFNEARSCPDRSDKGVHFFLDDYQFNRLWTHTDRYIELLAQFRYVMAPDFSTYTDFPVALQIYNHFRKHWVGAYLSEAGIDVIPTISWSTPDSFEWCFDGEPMGSAVAVSSVGCMNDRERKSLFLAGYREMIKRLSPETILFYGEAPDECGEIEGSAEIVPLSTVAAELKKRCSVSESVG